MNIYKNITRILALSLFGVLSSAVFADSFFVSGTYGGDTRYAVKKLFDGNDDYLCWAAAASNVIQLWQDNCAASGLTIPSGTPSGKTQSSYSTDVFATFVGNWTNEGGAEENGFNWWLSGGIPPFDPEASQLVPGAVSAGYWASLLVPGREIANETSIAEMGKDYLQTLLSDSMALGYYFTAGIYMDGGEEGEDGAHAISLWGYEYIDGELAGLWISDSDFSEFAGSVLVSVSWDEEDAVWYLGDVEGYDMDYNGWGLGDITVFHANSLLIPEPAEIVFIFGLAAFGVAILRRRRKA